MPRDVRVQVSPDAPLRRTPGKRGKVLKVSRTSVETDGAIVIIVPLREETRYFFVFQIHMEHFVPTVVVIQTNSSHTELTRIGAKNHINNSLIYK